MAHEIVWICESNFTHLYVSDEVIEEEKSAMSIAFEARLIRLLLQEMEDGFFQ